MKEVMSASKETRRPKRSVEGRDLGDEYLIYDRPNDQVHVLNGTAREILMLCDGSRTPGQIVAAIVEKYGVDEATAAQDTERTIADLVQLEVLQWD